MNTQVFQRQSPIGVGEPAVGCCDGVTLPGAPRPQRFVSDEGGGLARRLAALPLRLWRTLCSVAFEARLIWCYWQDSRERPAKSWWRRNVCDDAPDGV